MKVDKDEDIYLEIGNGKYQPSTIINMIYKKEEEPKTKKVIQPTISKDSDVVVGGIDKVKVNLANCCNPVPGDEIIGYITKGNGISVHRRNCHNLEFLDNRTVGVEWNNITNKKYETTIHIHSNSKDQKIVDILQKLSMDDINVDRFISLNDNKETIYEMDIYVYNTDHLNKGLRDLEKLQYVTKVERVIR